MHLKSLTLRGFKSFASATTLEFEPGITCIVGPNGSGKSNVVDALAWVMGEQGAKSLRGGSMEDVIFAGTAGPQGRPPLGRAEVSLTIDNSDGALPIEYTEVTISRTMFRNGGSDYAINGRSCRLLDVQELLSDSGIGREMHVIVGQGQLDAILHATPEERRGFVEEAAGVLKHRRRKEKALRKLEATEGNTTRLGDLLTELGRQLKPLGRQAEAARRAAVVQAEVRDVRARLLADELVTARTLLAQDREDEGAGLRRRDELDRADATARAREETLEVSLRSDLRSVAAAQETHLQLVALQERLRSTTALARERVRAAEAAPEVVTGRDPEELVARGRALQLQEAGLLAAVAEATAALQAAVVARASAEEEHAAEERRVSALRARAADRREGLARMAGQLEAKRSRIAAAREEAGRLQTVRSDALARQERAQREYTALETQVAGLSAGEAGLDDEHEAASSLLRDIEERSAKLHEEAQALDRDHAGLVARREALELGLSRADGAEALLAGDAQVPGVLGTVAALLSVETGYEAAVAAALGAAADAVVLEDLSAAVTALGHLRAEHLGRTGLVPGSSVPSPGTHPAPLRAPALWAHELVRCPDALGEPLVALLADVAVVTDLPAAQALVEERPGLTAVTRDGDLVSRRYLAGGSTSAPTRLEVQAAVDAAGEQLTELTAARERLGFELQRLAWERQEAQRRVDVALARLHESDAALAAVAEALAQHGSTARAAKAEVARVTEALQAVAEAAEVDRAALADLEERLGAAGQDPEEEPDLGRLDQLAASARAARAAETDGRLALRTAEERARALSGRADGLLRAAEAERGARARAVAHRDRIRRDGAVADAVLRAATSLARRLEDSVTAAAAERDRLAGARRSAEEELDTVRAELRGLQEARTEVLAGLHRDELARSERQLRAEQLEQRAAEELGLVGDALVAEYGPDVPVPVAGDPSGTVPFVRAEQEHRLRAAERALAQLGRVNPLALEEYSALEERHRFLSEQLDDLRRTRRDLLDIVGEVDQRVEEVFTEAWHDVSAAFDQVFARVFPGGEGRLVLTDPTDMLTTGIEVEARPPGKKVKRLSLLSGGERSLVAVAFLVALFKARPSPFYILDEVEAALDDTNLGRLLELYTELRDDSQLLVITHQKRTMEVADALYGVAMRGDGVSSVISQRLREPA